MYGSLRFTLGARIVIISAPCLSVCPPILEKYENTYPRSKGIHKLSMKPVMGLCSRQNGPSMAMRSRSGDVNFRKMMTVVP